MIDEDEGCIGEAPGWPWSQADDAWMWMELVGCRPGGRNIPNQRTDARPASGFAELSSRGRVNPLKLAMT